MSCQDNDLVNPGVLGFCCGIPSIFQYGDILGGYQSKVIF